MRTAVLIIIVFATGIVSAHERGKRTASAHERGKRASRSDVEKQVNDIRVETAMGNYGVRTAPATPDSRYGVTILADALYWQPKVTGSEFVYSDGQGNISNPYPLTGDLHNASLRWDWGFRVGLGYHFTHDSWDLLAQYTYFHPGTSTTTVSSSYGLLFPLQGSSNLPYASSGGFFGYAMKATTKYFISLDDLNLELGRDAFVSAALALRPFVGLKTAWITTKQNTTYSGGTQTGSFGDSSVIALGSNTFSIENTSRFCGLGVRTGFNSKWFLGKGISILGEGAASLVYGRFKVTHGEGYTGSDTIALNGDLHQFCPTVQLLLGLSYGTYLCHRTQYINLSLAYENQFWWEVSQMINALNTRPMTTYLHDASVLSFNGVTFAISWSF